jgi:manganese/zinc/iron transport system permease protein
MNLNQFIALDLPPLLAALGTCLACALLGNFLVLKRMSLLGDAIAHAVLPGIVITFLLVETRTTGWVFLGAALAGVLAAVLIDLVKDLGKLESSASMGVIFSLFFASGVLLMEQAAAHSVDLDADCLLHGQLETIFWSPPASLGEILTQNRFSRIPFEVWSGLGIFILSLLFVTAFYKELVIASFDPLLANVLGFSSRRIDLLLVILIASAVVASFTIVGSILVIAMLICPAAIARLYTDRLKIQLIVSVLVAAVAVIGGYWVGALGPLWLGMEHSVNAAGAITTLLGIVLTFAVFTSPRYGVFAYIFQRAQLSYSIIQDNILGLLFRVKEQSDTRSTTISLIAKQIHEPPIVVRIVCRSLIRKEFVQIQNGGLSLTDRGEEQAKKIVRSHRLWETYFVQEVGLSPDHVHPSAEFLEHFTSDETAQSLAGHSTHTTHDPHGKRIPKATSEREN